ncbi:MAG TPA: hypothetical protein VH500_15320 [Nitrososphaeraceae archaeon]
MVVFTTARVRPLPSSNYTTAGLNNKTVNIAVRNQDHFLNVARLYNASSTKVKGLNAAAGVLACLGADIYLHTINSSNYWYSVTKQLQIIATSSFQPSFLIKRLRSMVKARMRLLSISLRST